jgi:hypothetical protein
MAIGLNLTNTAYGIDFPEAYGRITNITVRRQSKYSTLGKYLATIDISIYANKEAADSDSAREIETDRLEVVYTTVAEADIISECYKWIVTQDKYLNATTV